MRGLGFFGQNYSEDLQNFATNAMIFAIHDHFHEKTHVVLQLQLIEQFFTQNEQSCSQNKDSFFRVSGLEFQETPEPKALRIREHKNFPF